MTFCRTFALFTRLLTTLRFQLTSLNIPLDDFGFMCRRIDRLRTFIFIYEEPPQLKPFSSLWLSNRSVGSIPIPHWLHSNRKRVSNIINVSPKHRLRRKHTKEKRNVCTWQTVHIHLISDGQGTKYVPGIFTHQWQWGVGASFQHVKNTHCW